MEYYQIFGRETCPWCCKACELLKEKGFNFMFCEMEHSPELIQYHKDKYGMKTVPIIVLHDSQTEKETFIGGCSDLMKYLDVKQNGEACGL